MDKIKGYKGFNPDLTCRDYKYEIGKEYDTDKAEQCESGFHFCEFPFDVFSYYPPSSEKGETRYAEVEGSGQMDKGQDKISCTHLSIKTEIGLSGIINAGVKFILDKVKWETGKTTNTGGQSAATNTGDLSAATNTGYQSAATNTGDRSVATNTGYQSAATNTGDRSVATNTGDRSVATNTGYQSAATNTGYYSAATVEGKDSIAIVTGKDSKAKGSLGCWIVLTERGEWNGETSPILNVKAFKVDNLLIKENVFYTLVNGEPVEVE